MWTREQSDLSLPCLLERLQKYFSRRQKQLNSVVIGALMVKSCKTTEPQTTKATSFIRLVCPVNVRRKNLRLTCLQTHRDILLLTGQGLLEPMWILVKISKADKSTLERLLLLHV